MSNNTFHTIVIGAGSGGLTVARSLAKAGKEVALIEQRSFGGDCTNYGCVPSKALLSYVRAHPACGLQKALEHTRSLRADFLHEEDAVALINEGIHTFIGTGVFKRGRRGARIIHVKTKDVAPVVLTTPRVVFATGSQPVRIDIAGVPQEKIITNEELFEIDRDVRSVCIIGGGYIGCEMAEALARAGTAVTMVAREDRLVPREEKESSAAVLALLTSLGVTVRVSSSIEVLQQETGDATLASFDYVLLTIGRVPRVPQGLAEEGVRVDRGIQVNAKSETSLPGVYAVGDCVAGNPTFTHWANNEARGLVRNLLTPAWLFFMRIRVREEVLPTVLYTTHEVARVGKVGADLTKERGGAVRTVTIPFMQNDRAKTEGDTAGFVTLHFTALFGRVLGGSIVGAHAGEMLPRLTAAVRRGERASSLSREVVAYPTRAEVLKKAADAFLISTLATWKADVYALVKTYALRFCAVCVWLAAVIYIYMYLRHVGETPLMLAAHVYMFVNATWYGPVAYMCLYMLRSLLFFPATLLTVLSGVIFGPVWGPLYTWVGENMSAQLSYSVGRFLRGNEEGDNLPSFMRALEHASPFMGVLFARLLFVPYDLFNYAAGFARVPWQGYTLATMLGIIPGMLTFVLAGAALTPREFFATGTFIVNWQVLIVAALCVALSVLLARLVRKK